MQSILVFQQIAASILSGNVALRLKLPRARGKRDFHLAEILLHISSLLKITYKQSVNKTNLHRIRKEIHTYPEPKLKIKIKKIEQTLL